MQISQERQKRKLLYQADYVYYFKDPNIQDYLYQDISAIDPKFIKLITQLYQKIVIYIDVDIPNHHQLEKASYLLLIGKSYPISGVRLYLIHNLVTPKLNDLRDLCPDVLGKQWTYKNTLKEICDKLEEFTQMVLTLNEKRDIFGLQKIGKYYIGEYFSSEIISDNEQLQSFTVYQKNEKKQNIQKIISITQVNFLMFSNEKLTTSIAVNNSNNKKDHHQFKNSRLLLELATNIQSISQIQYDKNDKIIILTFKRYDRTSITDEDEIIIKFTSENNNANILRKILKSLGKLQHIKINYYPSNKIQKSQLTRLKSIKNLEEEFKLRPTKQNREKLNLLYQNMVQYYTSKGEIFLYLIYVHKINEMLEGHFENAVKQKQAEQKLQKIKNQLNIDTFTVIDHSIISTLQSTLPQ